MSKHETITAASGQAEMRPRHGGQILIDALRIHGVTRVFGVPGESCLPLLDALRASPDMQFMMARHEAGASHMAEADGKMQGIPGVCLVSRGPGAMHATVGVHMAFQNSTPMLLLIGQVSRVTRGREGFQEMDYKRVFGDMTKFVAEVDDPATLPEIVSRAFHIATSGRPGPVVLSIPEDVFGEVCTVADAPRYRVTTPVPARDDLHRMRELLQGAARPLVVVGGSGWTAQASEQLLQFAAANDLPVAAAFRSQDVVDNTHPNYVGDLSFGMNAKLGQRVKDADLLIVVGDRMGEVTTRGYTLMTPPVPTQTLVHVYPGAEELGRVYHATLPIHAGPARFAEALGELQRVDASAWRAWRADARADYEAFQKPLQRPTLDLSKVVWHLRETLPEDTILTNGAGNYCVWLHRFYSYRKLGTQLAPHGGSMGYGVPAAIAAKLRHPERTVVALAGDGCFLMAATELATAVQYQLPIVIIIVNNALYGAIRLHQEKQFPGQPFGTTLQNPDFAALARSYGAFGETVTRDDAFPDAFARALKAGGPAIIELKVDPNVLSPDKTVDEVRADAARAGVGGHGH